MCACVCYLPLTRHPLPLTAKDAAADTYNKLPTGCREAPRRSPREKNSGGNSGGNYGNYGGVGGFPVGCAEAPDYDNDGGRINSLDVSTLPYPYLALTGPLPHPYLTQSTVCVCVCMCAYVCYSLIAP